MTFVKQSIPELLLSNGDINTIAEAFRQAMAAGLTGMPSPLKMLPSFLNVPDKSEQGRFLAVDFGGSHIRALEVELECGGVRVLRHRQQALPTAASAAELFGLAARLVEEVVTSGRCLGHTFSFPCHQQDVNTANLITWTKEITTPGVEGQDINRLLGQALRARGLEVEPRAILNDTVGTLLAAAYTFPGADIAAICGTGHNMCYLEPHSPVTGKPMIINMESGNFDQIPYTLYDERLDAASEKPGAQRLEKMVAGGYLGELTRLILLDLFGSSDFCQDNNSSLSQPYSLSTQDISQWAAEGSARSWLKQRDVKGWSMDQADVAAAVGQSIILRSAQLTGASCLGVLKHLDPTLDKEHVIAIDGSLYEKAHGYAAEVSRVVDQALGTKYRNVQIKLMKDGSGIGAAIAAAIVSKGGGS